MAETCIWCGLEMIDDTTQDTVYACGSMQHPSSDVWSQSTGCVQIIELRDRFWAAFQRLDIITSDAWEEGVMEATRILRGNALEIPDSSPITTDDLAASDYYEAVRQRVPWMVAVEHIEGLVEGFRRCGLMVWEVAEHIQRVYGGEYGKAE